MKWVHIPQDVPRPLNAILRHRLGIARASYASSFDRLWWSVLLDIRDTSLSEVVRRVSADVPNGILVPSVYSPKEQDAHHSRLLAAVFVRSAALERINDRGQSDYSIFSVADGMIHDEDQVSLLAAFAAPRKVTLTDPKSVVMAAIDDGIAIGHDLFRSAPMSSRIEYAWIMSAPRRTGEHSATIGRAMERAEIDGLLAACSASGVLDERRFYHETGQVDFATPEFSPVALRRSHGTHVTAALAGAPMRNALGTRPILCATLPPQVTQDVTGQSSLPAIALALQALHHQAKRFVFDSKKSVPVVLNFSFGNFGGPHDGTGEIDALIEQFLKAGGTQLRKLVLPAGNGNLSQTHAQVPLSKTGKNARHHLTLVIPPDDRTASYVQFWMPRPDYVAQSSPTGFRVTPPGCQQSPVLLTGGDLASAGCRLTDAKGQVVASLDCTEVAHPVGRVLITLSINPTTSLGRKDILAPFGRWVIDVIPGQTELIEQPKDRFLQVDSVQAWVRRDETLPGFRPGGRQAYFSDPDYQKFGAFGRRRATDPKDTSSLVRREGTLTGYGSGTAPVVVAAVVAKTRELSEYSASGPLSPPPIGTPARIGPDLSARGDDSQILRGIYSAGSSSGSFVRMAGTSVAAPAVARALADEITGHRRAPTPIVDGLKYRSEEGYLHVPLQLVEVPYPILEPH